MFSPRGKTAAHQRLIIKVKNQYRGSYLDPELSIFAKIFASYLVSQSLSRLNNGPCCFASLSKKGTKKIIKWCGVIS
jgi:hypothetical protein